MRNARRILRGKWLFPILLIGLAILTVIEPTVSASRQTISTGEALARVDTTPLESQPIETEQVAPEEQVLPADGDMEEVPQAKLDTTNCGTY